MQESQKVTVNEIIQSTNLWHEKIIEWYANLYNEEEGEYILNNEHDIYFIIPFNSVLNHEEYGDSLDIEEYQEDCADFFAEKAKFFSAYLRAANLDGSLTKKAMHSFLSDQLPSQGEPLTSVWFNQNDQDSGESGCYPDYNSTECQIFTGDLQTIDYADVFSIVPYDQIIIRKDSGIWTKSDKKNVEKIISEDLAFDGITKNLKIHLNGAIMEIDIK